MSIEAMKMALEAFELLDRRGGLGLDVHEYIRTKIEALRQAIEQAEKPCQTGAQCVGGKCPQCVPTYEFECPRCGHCCQQKEWVGLTDKDRKECWLTGIDYGWVGIMDATEAKLKEKKT